MGDWLLPEGETGIVLGRVFGVWLSRAITTMTLEQVWDLAGPADTGIININIYITPDWSIS